MSWLQSILESVRELVPADLAAVLELENEDTLRVLAAAGPLASARVEHLRVDLRIRPSLRAALAGNGPAVLDDAHLEHNEPDPYVEAVALPGDHSCLAAPLLAEGRLVGAMTLDVLRCGVFSSEELLRAIGAFARLAAMVIAEHRTAERLSRDLESLAAAAADLRPDGPTGAALVGRSRPWLETVERLRLVAPAPTSVLLLGETGSGKEQAARAVHQWSPRARRPFLAVNCSLLSREMAMAELFGHERGAFTGADRRRAGRFELADGGTLFLDEVAELPAEAQAMLLRVLQEGSFERLGGSATLHVDVRVIAATHRDLQDEVAAGRFRDDLFFRLGAFPVRLPPLRERPGDILLLAQHLLDRLRERLGMPGLALGEDAITILEGYGWPGNVRELGNVLERAAILAGGGTIGARHVELDRERGPERPRADEPIAFPEGYHLPPDLRPLEHAQATVILRTLRESGGRLAGRGGAAQRLGIPPSTLASTIKRLGLRDPRRSGPGAGDTPRPRHA
ncbi:MAG: GAF domain-containing protein [Acidobacteria bacterium]|nr:GAF domain-containing protein [Acidobacteriota bacterium]